MTSIRKDISRIALTLALTAAPADKAKAFSLDSLELRGTQMTTCSPSTNLCVTVKAPRSVESSLGRIVYFYNPTIEVFKRDGIRLQLLKPTSAYLSNDWELLVLKDKQINSVSPEQAIDLRAIRPLAPLLTPKQEAHL